MIQALPSLSGSKFLRLSSVTALYMAQGIFMGVIVISLPAVMASEGLSAVRISSFMGLVMLPWALKLLFAPFMDRFSMIALGRRRPWILFGTLLSVAGYLGMGMISDPFHTMQWLLIAGMVTSGCTAMMDVAVDGMVVDLLPMDEQAQANGLMWGGKVFGTALAAWGSGWMFKNSGVSPTFVAAGVVTLLFAMIPLLIRERTGEKLLPWTSGKASEASLHLRLDNWKVIGKNLVKVARLPASGLMLLLILTIGCIQGISDALFPVLTVQDLGWLSEYYSKIAGVAQLAAGLVGMVIGGWLINKLGHKRALAAFMIVVALGSVAMGALPHLWEKETVTISLMLVQLMFRTLALITCFSIGMALCWKQIAATQFAFYMAFGNLGISSGSFFFGQLSGFLSYSHIFYVLAGIALLAAWIATGLNLEKHHERIRALHR